MLRLMEFVTDGSEFLHLSIIYLMITFPLILVVVRGKERIGVSNTTNSRIPSMVESHFRVQLIL